MHTRAVTVHSTTWPHLAACLQEYCIKTFGRWAGFQQQCLPVAVQPAIADEELRQQRVRVRLRHLRTQGADALAQLLSICLDLLHRSFPT